jgi:hypothetical protein
MRQTDTNDLRYTDLSQHALDLIGPFLVSTQALREKAELLINPDDVSTLERPRSMDGHQNRNAKLRECLRDQPLLSGANSRRGSGHDCALGRHEHQVAHKHRVRFIDSSPLDVVNHHTGRPICVGERVMLFPHAVRRKVRSHLHRVEIGNRVQFWTGSAQQHRVQPPDLR